MSSVENVYYFNFLLFHYISSPIICSWWKLLLIFLKTIRKCLKFCEKKKSLFQNVWSLACSLVQELRTSCQMVCLPLISLCQCVWTQPFDRSLQVTDFILSSVSQKPSATIHCLQGKAHTFRTLNRQYYISFKSICLCVWYKPSSPAKLVSLQFPQTHVVLTCLMVP